MGHNCEYCGAKAAGQYLVRRKAKDLNGFKMYLCADHAYSLDASKLADPETKEGLWGRDGLPTHGKTDTETEAAKAVMPKVGSQRRIVYDFIVSKGEEGATDDEVAEYFAEAGRTFRHATRRQELEKLGLVVRTDERRKTVAGNNAIVFKAIEYVQTVQRA